MQISSKLSSEIGWQLTVGSLLHLIAVVVVSSFGR